MLTLTIAVYQQITYQYHRGDQAMRYSSFRQDPMGASVLLESLENIPGLTVVQNTEPITNRLGSSDSTLIFLGASTSSDPTYLLENLETFVSDGGKLVIALSAWSFRRMIAPGWLDEVQEQLTHIFPTDDPEVSEDDNEIHESELSDDSEAQSTSEEQYEAIAVEEERESTAKQPRYQNISDRWGLEYILAYEDESENEDGKRDETYYEVLKTNMALSTNHPDFIGYKLPEYLPWRSKVAFEDTSGEWATLYTINDNAVVMHRHMGDGEILLLSDSFVFSNECLKYQLQSSFISWALGKHHNIIFNESHLGGMIQGNIMTLIRRYNLSGFLFAFILIGMLFVWKSSVSLLPRRPAVESARLTRVDTYFDSTTTLSHLLRRGLDYRQLLNTAYDEWKKSSAYSQALPSTIEEQIITDLRIDKTAENTRKFTDKISTPLQALNTYNRLIERLRHIESSPTSSTNDRKPTQTNDKN